MLEAEGKFVGSSFILMDFIDGVEMGVGAYFDVHQFPRARLSRLGAQAFLSRRSGRTYRGNGYRRDLFAYQTFFDRTLGKMAPYLRENGYCGYINLNTVVNQQGIWPLEFTCRFGYPGYAILTSTRIQWAELFRAMLNRSTLQFNTNPGFAVGIVITTPPFPYYREAVDEPIGLPILFEDTLTPYEREHLHYGEVGLRTGVLVTSGTSGYTIVVTGTGETVQAARDAANKLADKVIIPNARFRRDIGTRLIDGELLKVEELGLFN